MSSGGGALLEENTHTCVGCLGSSDYEAYSDQFKLNLNNELGNIAKTTFSRFSPDGDIPITLDNNNFETVQMYFGKSIDD